MKKRLFSLLLILVLGLVLASCDGTNNNNKTNEPLDGSKVYETTTKKLTLSQDYEGKNFLIDGIGKATVEFYTDGDTSRFSLSDTHESVVVRYYSVNTPESTGGVEKWGKAASAFTKSQLSQAEEIVLEAINVNSPATKEGYGRYLGYVWIRRAGETKFINLNCLLVENGFSKNTGVNTKDYRYYSYFDQAQKFARNGQLHVWAADDVVDPLYNEDPIPMSIKGFYEAVQDVDNEYYNVENDSGANVEFNAYIKSLHIASSGTYTFVAAQYDAEEGVEYTINIYAGYASASGSKIKVGSYLHIVGAIQKHYGEFQISGIVYSELFERDTYTINGQKDYFVRFNTSGVASYYENDGKSLYSNLTVESAVVENGVLTIVGHAYLASKAGLAEEATTFTVTANVPQSYSTNLKAGDSVSFSGLQMVKDSHEILVVDYKTIK